MLDGFFYILVIVLFSILYNLARFFEYETVMEKSVDPVTNSRYTYVDVQSGADTGFSSGGGKSGAKRPKKFLFPPPELLRGGTEFKRKGKIK